MDSLIRDFRFALRTLSRSPAFFAVAVLTLALGIGATTALFSVVHGVLLRPLPYREPERIVQLWQIGERGGLGQTSDPNFEDLRAMNRSFLALAEMNDGSEVSVVGGATPVRTTMASVSREFFTAVGVQPIIGRTFVPEEQHEGGSPAIVVGERFWRQHLGGSAGALGTTLRIDDEAFRVVGVMPAALAFPLGVELWTPRELSRVLPSRTAHNWQMVGRLKPGVTVSQAQSDVTAIARELKQRLGDETQMIDVRVVPLREQIVGGVRTALLVLLAASAMLLLIACANVVNLLVARLTARRGELAVRLALGAGPRRIAQQLLAEALVLSLTGGVAGVALAALGVRALIALEPGNLPRLEEIGLDWPVLAFALGTSVVSALALGLVASWRAARRDPRGAMADAQRTLAGSGAGHRVRRTLVVAQVALTLVLLVGVGLLGRSLARVLGVSPGFREQAIIVMDVSMPYGADSASHARLAQLHDAVIQRLNDIPGVTAAGGANALPLAGGALANGTFLVMSRPDEPLRMEEMPRLFRDKSRTGHAEFRLASPGYFRAMGIPLLAGRLFEDRDAPNTPHVAVISQSLARARWPNEDPLGKTIQFGNMDGDLRPFTVVGVVGDVREASLASEPRPMFYAYYRQRPGKAATFYYVIASERPVAGVVAAARRALAEVRPDVPPRFRTVETVIAASVADRRFLLVLLGVFGAAALALATLGVYSVVAFLVTQRRQEIGVRVALGARGVDVLRMVLAQGATLALAGIGIGALAALALTRVLRGFLYDVSPTDPLAFLGVIALLTVVALLASLIPARRAARVDPMLVLRGS